MFNRLSAFLQQRHDARRRAQNERDAALNSSRAPIHEWSAEHRPSAIPEVVAKCLFFVLLAGIVMVLLVDGMTGPIGRY